MDATSNRLLASLSPDCLRKLLTAGQMVTMPLRAILYEPNVVPLYAYFLLSGIASVVSSGEDGRTVEVEVLGREALVGGLHLLGPAVAPTQSFMQVPGAALRLRMTHLRGMFLDSAELRGRILEFIQQETLVLSQIAGCQRMHSADQRLARWLLMVEDRTDGGTLALTHEFLAGMIGSERTTVSTVAAAWQKRGVVEYTRGQVRILDNDALKALACGCYAVARGLFQRLYSHPFEVIPAARRA